MPKGIPIPPDAELTSAQIAKKAYYARNRAKVIARARQWLKENNYKESREKLNARNRKYEATNPAVKIRHANREARRRAAKRGLPNEHVDRLQLLEMHDGRCGICGEGVDPNNFHIDHRIPLSLGGHHTYANTQPAHPKCNLSKGGRLCQ